MRFADRLTPLQTNVFADMDRAKGRARAAGKPIVDLSLGSSDLPTPGHVLDAIATALRDPATHGYNLFESTRAFRQAAARWYTQKFGVAVDPETEVLPLIGSQEGTAHLPLAILNPGDFALLTDPCYPSHTGGIHLANGQIYAMPLLAENGFLPVLTDIPTAVLAQARLMVLSYPHNPTTGIASPEFFAKTVAFCQEQNLVLAHDFPYADHCFDGYPAPSVLQADANKTCSIEFFSFSKAYNMGGFRIAYAIGNRELILALRQVKATVDFNQYQGILRGAIAALEGPQDCVRTTVDTFKARRDAMVTALNHHGWHVTSPTATMYLWAKLPASWSDSIDFCVQLVEATGIALAPGRGFGKSGEGYVRFALVQPPAVLKQAAQQIVEFMYSRN
ncbi:aspartate tyrosine aromatic aminotransferase [Leptolyngbya sp. Heron Island J]|uniref:LL-diaminopimelate aminotransferase n=1 Tax=Leptolyngbya sp. Heron Island J TaxID=1385935 RepID=UPI0003B9523E|nr:LL-diaminopimelate aminotransferase [Leptolyngbya sp. Heron Island J]ESA32500.1 aspartate tyrosine aromatic aminotransferase [Leptolyngbya sp. Heron Island J]